MRYELLDALAVVAGCLLLVGCPSDNPRSLDAGDAGSAARDAGNDAPDRDVPAQGGGDGEQDSGPTAPTIDGGLGCCPTGFQLYACQMASGESGFACHNPAMGCASSLYCGQGCDPQVSGRCPCVQTGACGTGYHTDPTLCSCVSDQDAGVASPDASPDAPCIDTVLCIQGDHFDPTLCKCVPDSSAACTSATDCSGALPALCQQCADGSAGCAHFTCVSGQCQIAYCP